MNSAAGTHATPTANPLSAAAAPAVTLSQVLLRLEQSRGRLRESLMPAPVSEAEQKALHSFHPLRRARAWLRSTPWGGVLDPALGAIGDELLLWWNRQGWRQSAVQAKDALAAELVPLVQRYPIAAVLTTAAAGALFVSSGVWRWRVVKRGLARLGLQLRHMGSSQLSSPAVQGMLLSALLTFIASKKPQPAGPPGGQAPLGPQPQNATQVVTPPLAPLP